VLGRGEKLCGGGHFDNPAGVHHGHGRRHALNYSEVVRYEEARKAAIAADALEQVKDAVLGCDIQRRDGFIQHQEFRLDGKGPRYRYALSLPATQFVRVAGCIGPLEAHFLQEPDSPFPGFAARRQGMDDHSFRDRVAYAHPRIKRSVRILKHNLHSPSQPPERFSLQMGDRFPVELNPPFLSLHESQHCARRRRLSAS
jgi:hypothetical protein